MVDQTSPRPLCHIVAPVGNLGYGFDEVLTAYHLAKLVPTGVPTAMILDSGSTDSGPSKLALGSMTCPRSSYAKDLTKLLQLVHTFRVPLIFSSAGGDGADEHVRLMEEIVEEICVREENQQYRFKTITTFSEIDKSVVTKRLRAGRITGCGVCVPALTEEDIKSSVRIVAQAGPEPFLDAMDANPDFDIIIGGRAYDPAPYVAYCNFQLKQQYVGITAADIEARAGSFLHMGKIMECGGQCATPKSHGAVATVYAEGVFEVTPLAPESKCTTLSVAAHTLYENTRPDLLRGPGGALDLNGCTYEQLDDGRSVRVKGSVYRSLKQAGQPYQLKLEAACVTGYRSMFMGSVRDHILIGQIDNLFPRIKAYAKHQNPDISGPWDIGFHVYGKGQQGPNGPGELFIIVEAIAETQQLATSLAAKARVAMIHGAYPGQKATSGNFAFGIGGLMEVEMGKCAQFSMYHLMELNRGEEHLNIPEGPDSKTATQLFKANCRVIGRGQPVLVDERFLSSIALLSNELTLPTGQSPFLIRQDDEQIKIPPKTLSDVASVLRSKNAGPYEITIDVIFKSRSDYDFIKESNVLTEDSLCKVLGVSRKDIVWMGFFEPALAFKVTIPRYRAGKMASSGSFMENDVHGSQQHTAVGTMKLPQSSVTYSSKSLWGLQRYNILAILAAFFGVGVMKTVRGQIVKLLEGFR